MIEDDVELYKGVIDSHPGHFDAIHSTTTWHKELRMTATGEVVKINRQMAYMSDEPTIYRYDRYELDGVAWSQVMSGLRCWLQAIMPHRFNSVLLNLYQTGKDEIRWHSDKEEQLGESPVIACLNFGATRTMHFKSKTTKEVHAFELAGGDLLVMKENCQKNWLHAILADKSVLLPRISCTFRWVQ
jgi:alkylated DNA repair dioxygenase AlkB